MAKNLLNGFQFNKFDGLDNGIEIPISNSLKGNNSEKTKETLEIPDKIAKNKPQTSQIKDKPQQVDKSISLPKNYDFKGKGIEPMVNVVPTFGKNISKQSEQKTKVKIQKDFGIDMNELGALSKKEDKVLYLAMRGWRITVEQRRGTLYHYAIKYIQRKKERIYLGSINT